MNRSPEQLHALVHYRLQQAVETLREASLLLDQSAWRGAQNRAYYAMFYAVSALLATRQLGSSKHSGVLGLFDREFVKPGLLPKRSPALCGWPSIAVRAGTMVKWGNSILKRSPRWLQGRSFLCRPLKGFLRESGFGREETENGGGQESPDSAP